MGGRSVWESRRGGEEGREAVRILAATVLLLCAVCVFMMVAVVSI